jgi:restriction endonuclease S subunit
MTRKVLRLLKILFGMRCLPICMATEADKQLAPDFLFRWFANLDLASMQSGTSVPQINQGHILSTLVPVPPLPEQRRIVSELDVLQAEVDALKRLQAGTAAELDALLPAILDRAFKGELLG